MRGEQADPNQVASDRAMFQRQSPTAAHQAANDNFIIPDFAAVRSAPGSSLMRAISIGRQPVTGREPLRIGLQASLVVAFAGLILIALSSAFLLGLAAVGVLAVTIATFQLLRRHVARPVKPVLRAFDRRAIGY
jgi:hypothetical protein